MTTRTWLFPSQPKDKMRAWVVQVLTPGATESEYYDFDGEDQARAFRDNEGWED